VPSFAAKSDKELHMTKVLPDKEVDLIHLTEAAETLLAGFSRYVQAVSLLDWMPNSGYLALIYRAILSRQHDALVAVVEMVRRDHGHAAVALLRPACEEYMWVKYLKSLSRNQAEMLVLALAGSEVNTSLDKQREFLGKDVMLSMGFSDDHLSRTGIGMERAKDILDILGRQLDLHKGYRNKGDRKYGEPPSMWHVADKTQNTDLYKYLYHATSRSVHFSIGELLRRAWGGAGHIKVESEPFRFYWSAFAVYWGLFLYRNTLSELADVLPTPDELGIPDDLLNEEQFITSLKLMEDFGHVPIITPGELLWPSDWPTEPH
jgi:hypothetical protein